MIEISGPKPNVRPRVRLCSLYIYPVNIHSNPIYKISMYNYNISIGILIIVHINTIYTIYILHLQE